MPPVRISSYTKILNGKVVRVNGYTTNRDASGMALRIPGRPFVSATPGQFPNGRGLPNIFPVEEVHGARAGAPGLGAPGSGDQDAGGITSEFDSERAVRETLLSAEQKAALMAYAGPQHKVMQSSLRQSKGKPTGSADIVNQIKRVDSAIAQSTLGSALTLWHAVNLLQGGIPRLPRGSTMVDFGFLEGSPSRSAVEGQGKHALVSIATPAGAKGLRLGDHVDSEGDGVLLPRGSRLSVLSDEETNGSRVIKTQLVVDPGNVLTAEEASQTSQRAREALKRRQSAA